jgi:hypothetical protein
MIPSNAIFVKESVSLHWGVPPSMRQALGRCEQFYTENKGTPGDVLRGCLPDFYKNKSWLYIFDLLNSSMEDPEAIFELCSHGIEIYIQGSIAEFRETQFLADIFFIDQENLKKYTSAYAKIIADHMPQYFSIEYWVLHRKQRNDYHLFDPVTELPKRA